MIFGYFYHTFCISEKWMDRIVEREFFCVLLPALTPYRKLILKALEANQLR